MFSHFETTQGKLPTKLANDVSDAIYAAVQNGMACDEAVSVALGVVCDYASQGYGHQYVDRLSEEIKAIAAHQRRTEP